MAENTTNYNLVKLAPNEFYNREIDNANLDIIDQAIKEAKDASNNIDLTEIEQSIEDVDDKLTQHLEQYEYQIPIINGTQIQLEKQSNSNRLLFKLESELIGNITISTDAGVTSKNLVDVDGVQVTSLDKGFHEVVAAANFFIIRNKGGLSKTDLAALITIVNEAESNESVLRTNYINTVNATDESINLPSTATWNDILLQIPNINSSKISEFSYSGVLTPVGTFNYEYSSGSNTQAQNYFEINVPFKPSSFSFFAKGAGSNNVFVTYYLKDNDGLSSDSFKLFTPGLTQANTTSVSSRNFKANSDGDFFYNNGILRVPSAVSTAQQEVKLIAYS